MSIAINNEPLSPLCNSYVSAAEMGTYLRDRVSEAVFDQWDALDVEVQRTYMVNAARFLDNAVEWIGDRYSRDQRLAWPRVNAIFDGFYLDPISFPQQVKDAACEMARWSMENDGVVSVAQNAAFDSIKVGPIAIDFNENVSGTKDKYFPDLVAYLLTGMGTVLPPDIPGVNRLKVVRLQRA